MSIMLFGMDMISDSLSDKNFFMEKSVRSADYILVVATKRYKQKADNRDGGVGIETYLSSALHWENLTGKDKKTNIIVIGRETESIPDYLKGHLYVDFSVDTDFNDKLNVLKKILNSERKYKRPDKQGSQQSLKSYHLTKVSDIIGIGAKNRTCLINTIESTDYSAGKKIKYELWELKNPGGVVTHILALHNNINITQTLDKAAEIICERFKAINTLLILRPREKKKGMASFESILSGKGYAKNPSVNEYTYDEYVWEYCIDSDFKNVTPPDAIEFYTSQEVVNSQGDIYSSGVNTLADELLKPSDFCANLIVGSGGIGKTSLCLTLVNKLIKEKSSEYLTIFIRSEDIRKYIENTGMNSLYINNIYDIYEMQAKYLNHVNVFDRNTFLLSILSGKIIIIIDGLDELSSIFGDKFELISFLKSLAQLHDELGETRILLTTRENNVISQELIESLNINSYDLLGFKIENCIKYLKTRFKNNDDKDTITSKIITQIEKCSLSGESRIIPFFVDVIANIYEDNLNSDDSENEFNLSQELTPYPSLNEINDHVINSIFIREKVRHKYNISVMEMIDLFKAFNIEIGEKWDVNEASTLIGVLYENQQRELTECILKNPLLNVIDKRQVVYKYDFLHSYFNSLSLMEFFTENSNIETTIKLLSKAGKDTPENRDLYKFLSIQGTPLEILTRPLVKAIEMSFEYESKEKIKYERAVSAIENIIYLASMFTSGKKDHFTDVIKGMYDGDNSNKISGLFINGDVPALNLSNLSISHSKFKNYRRFLKCDFENTKFTYTQFASCHNESIRTSSFLEADIDRNTCDIGDLDYTFSMLSNLQDTAEEQVIDDLTKFLSSFYKGSSFIENKKTYIRFSNRIPGLKVSSFSKLLSNGFIIIKAEKEVDTFFMVAEYLRPSVRRFLNDGYKDAKIRKIIDFVKK
ncbi:NACHT domain-containing protein [Pectobacterium brasiliense]|uniref:NACHT domain-containing protein n=1 Tax=Pectobacterium brasiliense TaxID=180957 RepID=UPI00227B6821|nr:NACHT domain-containing protein [Pectobacterium brasiliense]WGL28915.1 NACHT domain-containing protein [Pectobacterium brasiliense]